MSKENSWLFNQEELNHPPSIEYMTLTKEREWRRLANRFVLNVAKAPRLKLSRATITTAQIFIHRYYMRRTFKDNPWDVSIGAILLASKIEYEYTSRISRYLIHECARTAKKIDNPYFELNRKEKEYGYWKNNMLYYEAEILRILYYDLNIEEPYSYSIKWCKKYNVSIEKESVINYLLNESYIKTVLCLQYPSKTIAAGAFVLASFDNKNIDWNNWKKDLNIPSDDIKDVSIKLKEMLTKINEKSPSHHPHKYLLHKSLSLQDFVKSPSPLKISSMNNDIDKNNADNKNNNNSHILSSPPKSDNSDNHEKDNEKSSKLSKLSGINNEIQSEIKHSLNENDDWEVVDMDIDDDDDIPNPSSDVNSDIKTLIIQNKESNIKKDNINNTNTPNNSENNNIKYDKFKIKNNYPYYQNSRKHYPPPPPPYHFSRLRSRGNNNYIYNHTYSRYTNNYSNSGQNYYNRNSNSSFYRTNPNRNNNIFNHKLNNSNNNNSNNNNDINNINNINMSTLSPKYNIETSKSINKSRNVNYYPQY
ncbi:hypothetical protein BCR32DRAFT_277708 [Anaeromyces robustus]|uniref:Uncharacterized protein n=1 Tax=Anaeromyces robustus TaxID=1754192 RepID=A0A1Y1XDC7_9FUNG|nr:hypothetical protein BCR32DRAFT_277708 [Anaeromyces robustus]|eukprot:ORX83791.1 hypothetical protein BCR32DRAFT_277708 [Anaeromyces robustus]